MAELRTGENMISSSPSSDYDPLGDDVQINETNVSDEEPNYGDSSEEQDSLPSLEPGSFDRYAITPPVNVREMQRLKGKRRSHTVGSTQRDILLAKGKANGRTGRSAFTEHIGDVRCEIEAGSPEDKEFLQGLGLSEKGTSTKKKKDATKTRSFDRELKRRASDVGSISTELTSLPLNLNGSLNLKIDSPNRFKSLHSTPVSVAESRKSPAQGNVLFLKNEDNSQFQRRSTSYSNLECPQERLDFHKTFSALINLHNNPEKKKKETESSPMQYVRQLSSELQVYQTQLSDLVWLELQSRLRDQTIEEHDQYLYKARNAIVPDVLNDILNFKVRLKNDKPDSPLSPVKEDVDFHLSSQSDSASSISDTTSGSNSNFAGLTQSNLQQLGERLNTVISEQKDALLQVTELLSKLDIVESLYPTTKAVGKNHPSYASEQFQSRLNTLYLWQNITKDIGSKLSLMANVLYVDRITGINWPWLDYESPRQVLQTIRDTSNIITPDIVLPSSSEPNNLPPPTSNGIGSSGSSTSSSGPQRNSVRNSNMKGILDHPGKVNGISHKREMLSQKANGANHQNDGLSDDSGGLNHSNAGLSDRKDGLSDNNDGLNDCNDGLSDNNYGLSDHNDGLSDTNDGLSDHNDGLSDTNDGLSDHNDGLSDTNDGLSDHNDGLSDNNDGLSDHNDGLSDNNDGLSDRNDGSSDSNEGSNDNMDEQNKCNDVLSDDKQPQDAGLSGNNDGLSDNEDTSGQNNNDIEKNNSKSNYNDGLSDDEPEHYGDGLSDNEVCDSINEPQSVSNVSQIESATSQTEHSSATLVNSTNSFISDTTPKKLSFDALSSSTPNTSARKLSSGKSAHVRFMDVSTTPETSPNDSNPNLVGMSPPEKSYSHRMYHAQRSISNISSVSRSDSTFSIDDSRTGIYRHFVEKHLKKMGLRKLMGRLKDLLDGTLQRARQALEPSIEMMLIHENQRIPEPVSPSDVHLLGSSPSMDGTPTALPHELAERRQSLVQHGQFSADFSLMGLPSFLPTYLFLVRVPLDVVHECLRLRLEQRPDPTDVEPSILSIRQLIRECKEVLMGAVMVKSYYQQMLTNVLPYKHKDHMENDLAQYEEDLQQILDVYFDYMRIYMSQLQTIYEMSKRLKNFLEDEWHFTQKVCPHVRGGEANAGKRFCLMASSLLASIGNFLESNMDDCLSQLYDSLQESVNESEALHEVQRNNSRSGEVRKNIAHTCRTFKETFAEARERASKALGFAKLLRKDLEIAADFNIQASAEGLFDKLLETEHTQVVAPHSPGYMMFVPERIEQDHVIQLLNVSCGHDDSHSHLSLPQDGYLILVRCSECTRGRHTKCQHWKGSKLHVEPTAETTIALSHINVEGLFLVVLHSSQLHLQCRDFSKLMGPVVQLINEQTSCHQAIAESLKELRDSAMELRRGVADAIQQADEQLNSDMLSDVEECERLNIQKLYRETLHQCYSFGFEYHKELLRLVSGELREKLAKFIVEFAILWMKFVTEKCERGKGVKPRWAKPGLDFLCVACEPRVTAFITESEFTELKTWMNKCIIHVIGERVHPSISPGRPSSPLPERLQRNISCPQGISRGSSRQSSHTSTSSGEPSTPLAPFPESHSEFPRFTYERKYSVPVGLGRVDHDVELLDGGEEGGIVLDIHGTTGDALLSSHKDSAALVKRRAKIHKLEQARTNSLYAARQIGRVTYKKQQVEVYITNKKVNFKWQRGIKIGEGQFGKVYTVVNTDSGELMAVKEIRFQPNDHQTIKDVSEEIKIFEDLQHPGLVKYYGVEVHRDEMLIFMEYCAEGTIEEVAKQGLGEAMVRKYTGEILQAVAYLHEHDIVHRDIKGANIFLTLDGPVKLGDFGCAVKLKNHTTMPGEINTLVGTTAFMAPEVITRNEKEGTGRASDIWSVACVVLEMTTGKRPWHELKNNFNIMYKVGTGGTPAVPDTLSHEGKKFLHACLVHEPCERPTASDLLFHPFLKVELEEDNY